MKERRKITEETLRRGRKLFDAVTDLPDELIEEAGDAVKKTENGAAGKKHKRVFWTSLAACAALAVLGAGIGIYGHMGISGGRGKTDAILAVTFPKAYAYDDYDARSAVREENPVEEEFLDAVKEFAWQTSAVFLTDQASNANYSPLSFYYALSLAASGAKGQTAKELLGLLGANNQDQLSNQCGNLYRRLYADTKIGTIKIANSLWLSEKIPFKADFIENAAKNFYSPAYHVDFTAENTSEAMAEWIADNTGGTLKPALKTDGESLMTILNTIYYKAEWIDRFDKSKTKKDVFYLSDGNTADCDYMHSSYSSAGFTKGDDFTSASLGLKYYGSMVFVLPDEGVSVQELCSPEKLKEAFDGEQNGYGRVVWQIPKFDFDSKFDLVEGLGRLGVNAAFDMEEADFSRITDKTAFISGIHQETHISIDEKGVEASAFTQIDYAGAGMPKDSADMILNRPFLYGIISNEGVPIFIGICENPVQSR